MPDDTAYRNRCQERYGEAWASSHQRMTDHAEARTNILDLFVPREYDYEFKVSVTNQRWTARAVVEFHEGRGAQEGIFAELKSHCQMEYIPVKKETGNQTYLLAALLAHNLTRELQMTADGPQRGTNGKRSPLWVVQQLGTIRQKLLLRVGRLTRPGNKWVLSISADAGVGEEMNHYLDALQSMT